MELVEKEILEAIAPRKETTTTEDVKLETETSKRRRQRLQREALSAKINNLFQDNFTRLRF